MGGFERYISKFNPKSRKTEDPSGFNPISLCYLLYNIISSVIVNVLKPLLKDLISPEHTGFVEGH